MPSLAAGGAGRRRPALRDPPPPRPAALLSPASLRRMQALAPPPLLFFFGQGPNCIAFEPAMEPPNRVPPGPFSMTSDARFGPKLLGCRHGLVLMFDEELKEVLVWDPVAGDQHSLAAPPGFDTSGNPIMGTVLRAVGDAQHFQVVLAGTDGHEHTRVFTYIYSSETGVWSDLISTPLPSVVSPTTSRMPFMFFTSRPAVLAGGSLYWTLTGIWRAIIEFDLDRQSLAVINLPMDKFFSIYKPLEFMVMPAEGGELGLLLMSDLTARLWKMNTGCDGVGSWVLIRTIDLGKLLSLNSEEERRFPRIIGFAEYNNVVLLSTAIGLFMIQLETLQFKMFPKPSMVSCYHPFESVYVAGI